MRKFLVTSWDENAYKALEKSLFNYGVQPEEIVKITKRESRGSLLNKYIQKHKDADYIYLLDEDIRIVHGDLERLQQILDNNNNIGLASIPSYQINKGFVSDFHPTVPANTPISNSLKNISGFMDTFNLIVLKKAALEKVQLDPDIFGSQMIDIDLGWELHRNGFQSVADCSQALVHKQTDWGLKNLFYHAAVSRNRHIVMKKWSNRDSWVNVHDWNEKNNNEIPSLEELSHANEDKLIKYIARFDKSGLFDFYFNKRFANNELLTKHMNCFKEASDTKSDYNLTIVNNKPTFSP